MRVRITSLIRSVPRCLRSSPTTSAALRKLHISSTQVSLSFARHAKPGAVVLVHGRTYSPATPSLSTSFPDPTRSDLFYHLVDPPTPLSSSLPAFALSFLATPPPSSDSSSIIGWLPAATNEDAPDEEAGLNDFKENAKFRSVLHQAIQDGLRESVDEVQTNGALQIQNGWMHVHDDRNIPALGRIGDPDDILASVLVEDGRILPETYQPMPSYRFCTADGIIQLTPGLAQKLKSALAQLAESESERVS